MDAFRGVVRRMALIRSLFYNPIEMGREVHITTSPHIVLKASNIIWTSIALFLKKAKQ